MTSKPFVGYVYCATNAANGKRYIGITIQAVCRRWRRHLQTAKSGRGTTLHDAIRKHGESQFTIEAVAVATSHAELLELERTFIASFGTMVPNGYNRTLGGVGSQGLVAPCKTRSKMSAAAKARWSDPEFRERQRLAKIAAWERDAERKARLTARLKGRKRERAHIRPRPWTEEDRARNEAYWTTERRGEYAEQSRKRWADAAYAEKVLRTSAEALARPDVRERISTGITKAWQSEGRKAKAAEAMKIRWFDPARRQRAAKASSVRWEKDPAYRERMSQPATPQRLAAMSKAQKARRERERAARGS